MRLLLQEYFQSLKERDELDLIVPDLLSLMGMRVFSFPQKGTRQFGVDVAAISTDENGDEMVNLFVLKQGDLTANTWDGDKNSVRQSLNEIVDVYISQQLSAEHKNKPIIIYCVFGGNLTDRAKTNYYNFLKQNTTDTRTYVTWTSSKLADLAMQYIFNERILTSANRHLIQKALSMVDEPTIGLTFFKDFVMSSFQKAITQKEVISILRSIRLAYLILSSWAYDADNLEIAYLSGELTLLYCWNEIRKLEISSKTYKDAEKIYSSLIGYHLSITDDYINKTILPFSKNRFAISALIPSRTYLDVNLKLFDILGRISLHGIWLIYDLNRSSENLKEDLRLRIRKISKTISQIIENNPALLTPITDDQTIDISLAVLFLKHVDGGEEMLHVWLLSMQNLQYYALYTRNVFTTNRKVYSDLLSFVSNPNRYSREKDTLVGSSLQAHMLLWAKQFQDDALVKVTKNLINEFYRDCNIQIWLPDVNTEDAIYVNSKETGSAFDELNEIDNFPERLLELLRDQKSQLRFSADAQNFWPLLLVASRHHRIPVNPAFHFV